MTPEALAEAVGRAAGALAPAPHHAKLLQDNAALICAALRLAEAEVRHEEADYRVRAASSVPALAHANDELARCAATLSHWRSLFKTARALALKKEVTS